MAVPVPSTKQEIASKLVQKIAIRCDEIPERYLHKDGFPKAIDAPDLWRNDLLIDFSLLSSATSELAKLRSALSEWGCFQVVNHGIESTFLEELIEISKKFFALPLEEKLKYLAKDNVFEGYGTDTIDSNWNDRLFLTLHPEEKRKLEFWPTMPGEFREVIDEYTKRLANIIDAIYKAMARSLNLKEDCFINNQGKKGLIMGRFGLYPRCPKPDHILGGNRHSDTTTMTIVMPEMEVEGLQIEKDDQWYKVPVIPGALFVNLGDLGEVMTNGVFKSVEHRVVTNSIKERISVVAFFFPEEEKEIGPLSELISNHQPQLYKNSNIHEIRQMMHENYQQGHRTLDALKLYNLQE